MEVWHGRNDSVREPRFEEGMFGMAFVCGSSPREAFTTGETVDCYEVLCEKFAEMRVVDIRSPEAVRDYVSSGSADADIIIYPYQSQCSSDAYLMAFLTERSFECLELVD